MLLRTVVACISTCVCVLLESSCPLSRSAAFPSRGAERAFACACRAAVLVRRWLPRRSPRSSEHVIACIGSCAFAAVCCKSLYGLLRIVSCGHGSQAQKQAGKNAEPSHMTPLRRAAATICTCIRRVQRPPQISQSCVFHILTLTISQRQTLSRG